MHTHFADDPDMESIMIDGAIVRPCCSRAPGDTSIAGRPGVRNQKEAYNKNPCNDAWQSVGFYPYAVSSGCDQAYSLIEGVKATYALMDKAYDADKLIAN